MANNRSLKLQQFVDAAFAAFDQFAPLAEGRQSISSIFSLLETPDPQSDLAAIRLPVCEYLDTALDVKTDYPSLKLLISRFQEIEPLLRWRLKSTFDQLTASDNFVEGHANAMILGPGGLEDRSDVWLGVTLMAPGVRYPDHDHAPEEAYLVLSESEFFQDFRGWFKPGVGGSFYNVPGILHAMRSGVTPLLAFWALREV